MFDLHSLKSTVEKEASQCVKCGLCLSHCPTYLLTQNECESPRGRIALLEGLATNQLPLTGKLEIYLDHCLTCRACEVVCPAKVPYGNLIDHGRNMLLKLHDQKTKPSLIRLLSFFIRYPWLFRWAHQLLYFYQKSGFQFLLRKTKLLNYLNLSRTEELLPLLTSFTVWESYYPAKNQEQGRVALFIGCITNFVDQVTLIAAIKILTMMGYGVYVPAKQRCCAAFLLHAGYSDEAEKFTALNRRVFEELNICAVITVASGCSTVLQESLPKVMDISQFLAEIKWPVTLSLRPLKKRIAIHTPCTLRNILKQSEAPYRLMRMIPEVTLMSFSSNAHCCGAAGLYFLQHPNMAGALLQPILNQLENLDPDYLVTSNIGCALHLQSALLKKGSKLKVLHPVALLVMQLMQYKDKENHIT